MTRWTFGTMVAERRAVLKRHLRSPSIAETGRSRAMCLAFVGEGVVYNPEAGIVVPDAGESELPPGASSASSVATVNRAIACRHRARREQAPQEDALGLHRRGRRVQPGVGLVMPDLRREQAGGAGITPFLDPILAEALLAASVVVM